MERDGGPCGFADTLGNSTLSVTLLACRMRQRFFSGIFCGVLWVFLVILGLKAC